MDTFKCCKMNKLNGYDLSKNWFLFVKQNPDLINVHHSAMYFYLIELCNSLNWQIKIALPREQTKIMIAIKSNRTYTNTFEDLVEWGFIKIVQRSKNQHQANVISLNSAHAFKASAQHRHRHQHSTGTGTGTAPIIKQYKQYKQEYKEEKIIEVEVKQEIQQPNLADSNLFRKPIPPTKQQVWESFVKNDGTKEMAKKFWENNESTGWFYKGSPIVNFQNLVPGFVEAWKKNNFKSNLPPKVDQFPKPHIDEMILKYKPREPHPDDHKMEDIIRNLRLSSKKHQEDQFQQSKKTINEGVN